MPGDRSVSPPIPDEAVKAAEAVLTGYRLVDGHAEDALDAAAPALYKAWGENATREDVVEELAFRLACVELWSPRTRGKRQRWAQLTEPVRESYRKPIRSMLAFALGLDVEGER